MDFYENGRRVIDQLGQYLTESRNKEKPVIHQRPIEEIQTSLDLDRYIENGGLTGPDLDVFVKKYLSYSTRLHHPGYLAHQVGIPHPTGALASLIDGFTNNAMAIYEMGPSAAAVEFFIINYLLQKIGWAPMPLKIEDRLTVSHGGGVLTHGGSLANLTALLAARNHLDPRIRESGNSDDLVILAPASSHYIISKAAGIIGIGEKNVIALDTDPLGRIRPDRLDAVYEAIKKQNKRIIALVANGGATGTGLYDAIDDIGTFCNERDIWFHVDGAHGACALFSSRMRKYLDGIQKADSIVLDAHKMLRTPLLCAALLVKNAEPLDFVFEPKASYLFHEKQQPGFDFIQQTIECTKAGLGLKFYFTLAALGEKGIETYLDRENDLTLKAYKYIKSQEDFCCPYYPESNILCFRIKGPDTLQLAIRDQLIQEGRFYISSTLLNTSRYLRIVCISPETGIDDIKDLITAIKRIKAGIPKRN